MNAGDQLLHVASARCEIPWNRFKDLFDSFAARAALSTPNSAAARFSLARVCAGLGHWDVAARPEGLGLIVAPSVLVRLPSNVTAAVLAGARSLQAISRMRGPASRFGVEVKIDEQGSELAALIPCRVTVQAKDVEHLEQFAACVGLEFQRAPAAWLLGHFSADLDAVAAALSWERVPELNWQLDDFDTGVGYFRRRHGNRPESCLTRYRDPVRRVFRYHLWNGDVRAEVQADWGRYLALRGAGKSVLYYDRNSGLCAVPRTVPLPSLLARAMTLCSGYAPRAPRLSPASDGFSLDAFQSVPKAVVELVAKKLKQDICSCRLDL